MTEAPLASEGARLRSMVALSDKSTEDARACIVALVQALPPMAAWAPLDEALRAIRAGPATSEQLQGGFDDGDTDTADFNMFIGEFFQVPEEEAEETAEAIHECPVCIEQMRASGPRNIFTRERSDCITLTCGHKIHRACFGQVRDHTPTNGTVCCPLCRAPEQHRCVKHNVQIPADWVKGDSFTFEMNSDSNREAWEIKPGRGCNPGDIIAVSLDQGTGSTAVFLQNPRPIPLSVQLQRVVYEAGDKFNLSQSNEMRGASTHLFGHLRTVESVDGCTACGRDGHFSQPMSQPLGLHVGNFSGADAAPSSIETFMANWVQADSPFCGLCTGCSDLYCKDWRFDAARDLWHRPVRDDMSTFTHSPVRDGCAKQHLVTLPAVFHVSLSQARHRYGGAVHFVPVDIPVLGLDLSPYFSDKCPPPNDACTLYDLRFMSKLSPMEFSAEHATGKCLPGSGRYRGYSKSAVDNLWYEFDVCYPRGARRRPELDVAARMTSMCATELIYVRRDAMRVS